MGSYDRIANDILPKWLEHFKRKNADYSSNGNGHGDLEVEPHTVLGTAGQFGDIWRKVWKLKKALWDGVQLTGEQPPEILFDLIGHCFLTLDLLYQRNSKKVHDPNAIPIVIIKQGNSKEVENADKS